MSLISSFIDLEERLLSVESTRCKDKLYIRIKAASDSPRSDEFDSHDYMYALLSPPSHSMSYFNWFYDKFNYKCDFLA